VGNYQNLAEWTASVNRVSALLLTWDGIDAVPLRLPAPYLVEVQAESMSGQSSGEAASG
jgi:hypothetical protein